ncbi:hypothetical protein AM496_03735 [Helicobacter pylori]|uniref:Uncharacterized protein n=1 Tax=Helicobacter pylori TaxID=210 RepID=A0ABD4B6D4_HELPX|nr:hypothetical protein AM496_03735 [Helicobacter pylori]
MLKRLAKTATKNHSIAYFRGLVFKIRILNFFYYAIFGSVILKLFKNGLFCFCHFKTHFKKYFKFIL